MCMDLIEQGIQRGSIEWTWCVLGTWKATCDFLHFGVDAFKPVNVSSGSSSNDVVWTTLPSLHRKGPTKCNSFFGGSSIINHPWWLEPKDYMRNKHWHELKDTRNRLFYRQDAVFSVQRSSYFEYAVAGDWSIKQWLLSPFFYQSRLPWFFYIFQPVSPTANTMMFTKAIFALYLAIISLAAPPDEDGNHRIDIDALNDVLNGVPVNVGWGHSTNQRWTYVYVLLGTYACGTDWTTTRGRN